MSYFLCCSLFPPWSDQTWEDSRPGKLTPGIFFCIESDFQVENTQILYLNLEKYENRANSYMFKFFHRVKRSWWVQSGFYNSWSACPDSGPYLDRFGDRFGLDLSRLLARFLTRVVTVLQGWTQCHTVYSSTETEKSHRKTVYKKNPYIKNLAVGFSVGFCGDVACKLSSSDRTHV